MCVFGCMLLLLSRFSHVRLCATHRRQPTRLPHPWDSPGKNTGVGCHFLFQCVKVKSLNPVWLLAIPWTSAYQAPPSLGFSRQEYWSGVTLSSPPLHSRPVKSCIVYYSVACHLVVEMENEGFSPLENNPILQYSSKVTHSSNNLIFV